jgi:hypothetical protein
MIQYGLLIHFDAGFRCRRFLKRDIVDARHKHWLIYLGRVQHTIQEFAEKFTECRKFLPLGNIMNAGKFENLRVLALICQAPSLSGYDDWIIGPDGEQYGCRNCWLVDRLIGGP